MRILDPDPLLLSVLHVLGTVCTASLQARQPQRPFQAKHDGLVDAELCAPP